MLDATNLHSRKWSGRIPGFDLFGYLSTHRRDQRVEFEADSTKVLEEACGIDLTVESQRGTAVMDSNCMVYLTPGPPAIL